MPLVLSTPAQILTWLDTSSQAWSPKVANLIRPFSTLDEKYNLVCYAVPKEIGKIGRESSTLIEPVSKRKDGIEAMFAKQKQKKPTEEEKGTEKGKEEKGRRRRREEGGEGGRGSTPAAYSRRRRGRLRQHAWLLRASSSALVLEPGPHARDRTIRHRSPVVYLSSEHDQ